MALTRKEFTRIIQQEWFDAFNLITRWNRGIDRAWFAWYNDPAGMERKRKYPLAWKSLGGCLQFSAKTKSGRAKWLSLTTSQLEYAEQLVIDYENRLPNHVVMATIYGRGIGVVQGLAHGT